MILGLYTFGFNSADNASTDLAISSAVNVQGEQLAQSGLSMALVKMGNNSSYPSFKDSVATMGGKVIYTFTPGTVNTIISTSTIISGSIATNVTQTSVVTFNKGRWRISRTFSQNS